MLIERGKALAYWAFVGAVVAASFSNSFFEIFSIGYLLVASALLIFEKRWEFLKNGLAVLAGLYFLAAILSLTQTQYWDNSLKGIFRILRCVLMCFLTPYAVDTRQKFKTAFYVIAVGVMVIGLDAILQAVTGFDLIRGRMMTTYTHDAGRVTGPFRHANDFSAYLSLMSFLFFGMIPHAFLQKDLKKRIFFMAGSVVAALCLLWTYARGAWLAVGISFVAMAIFKRNRTLILGMVLFGVTAFLFSSPSLQFRIRTLGDVQSGTFTERRFLWGESLRMIGQKPWLGYGVNTYSKMEPYFKSKEIHTDYQYAHNGYLQMAAEMGLVGLGSFLLFLVSFFISMARSLIPHDAEFTRAAAASIVFGVLAFLLHSATDTDLQSLRLVSVLWLSMGLALAAKKTLGSPPA